MGGKEDFDDIKFFFFLPNKLEFPRPPMVQELRPLISEIRAVTIPSPFPPQPVLVNTCPKAILVLIAIVSIEQRRIKAWFFGSTWEEISRVLQQVRGTNISACTWMLWSFSFLAICLLPQPKGLLVYFLYKSVKNVYCQQACMIGSEQKRTRWMGLILFTNSKMLHILKIEYLDFVMTAFCCALNLTLLSVFFFLGSISHYSKSHSLFLYKLKI